MLRARTLVALALIAATQLGCGSSPDTDAQTSAADTPGTPTPPSNIFDLVSDVPQLSTLTTGIAAADLEARFESKGPYTLFAPTNNAWEQLGTDRMERLMTTETKNLRQGILNHTVGGRYLSTDLRDGQRLKSLGGPPLVIRIKGETITVSGAEIVSPNSLAGNGVVHVINKVIR